MKFIPSLLVLTLIGSGHVIAQGHQHGAASDAGEQLGTVSFATSCSPAVKADFERGVALLHSFWYEESEKQFQEIAKKDPACAMAHWGLAMSLYHQLWDRATGERLKRAVTEAQIIGASGPSSARSTSLIRISSGGRLNS